MSSPTKQSRMISRLYSISPRNWPIFYQFIVVFSVLVILGLVILNVVMAGQSSNRITTMIQFLAALGTLSLAAATFYNVQQTNRDLRFRRRQREKPLATDELSNVVEPAIQAVSDNIQSFEDDEHGFDWIYVEEPRPMNVLGTPRSVIPIYDIVALQRLSENDRDLYQHLIEHDEMVNNMGEISKQIISEVSDSVGTQLERAGYEEDDYSQSIKVFVLSMFQRLDHFGENHEMYDFWEENREELIEILDQEAGDQVDDLEDRISAYQDHCQELLERLQQHKAEVQQEYGISSEDIDDTDPFER